MKESGSRNRNDLRTLEGFQIRFASLQVWCYLVS